MQCPVCDVTLTISSREGVEIDFCPQCRGVWLDRGELDKIIDRAGAVLEAARMAPPPPVEAAPARGRYDERAPEPRPHDDRYRDDRYRDDRYRDDRDRYDDDWRRKKSKKKRGFDMLEDLFDF